MPYAFLLAAVSLIYELNFAKVLTTLAGNPVLWESLAIGAFVFGMGLGSWSFAVRPPQSAIKRFISVELCLTFIGGLGVHLLYAGHILYRIYLYPTADIVGNWLVSPLDQFGLTSLLLSLAVGFLSGQELPLLLQLLKERQERLLPSYYLGTLGGTLVLWQTIVLGFDPLIVGLLCGSVNLFVCFFLLKSYYPKSYYRHLAVLPIAFGLLAASLAFSDELTYLQIKNYYYNKHEFSYSTESGLKPSPPSHPHELRKLMDKSPDVIRHKSAYQNIDIVPSYTKMRQRRDGTFSLYLNGRFQMHSKSQKEYHEGLGLVPLSYQESDPREVLVLGAGDGLLVKQLLRVSEIEKIVVVELDCELVQLATESGPLSKLNARAFSHPKVSVHCGDAYQYLQAHQKVYPIIYVDFPYPYSFDSARLYSFEMFRRIAARLSAEGIMALNSPVDFFSSDNPRSKPLKDPLTSTLAYAGFSSALSYNTKGHHFVVASREELKLRRTHIDVVDGDALVVSDLYREGPKSIELKTVRRHLNTVLRPTFVAMKEAFF